MHIKYIVLENKLNFHFVSIKNQQLNIKLLFAVFQADKIMVSRDVVSNLPFYRSPSPPPPHAHVQYTISYAPVHPYRYAALTESSLFIIDKGMFSNGSVHFTGINRLFTIFF